MSPFCPLVFLSCIGVGFASFNCLNPGCNCKQNAMCDYFGRCKCPPGFQGYDCGLDSATISSAADCRATCLNKGICYSNTLCYCTEDYVGPQCETPTISAQCTTDSLKVRSFQPLTFKGEMYLKQSKYGCQLREMVTDVPGMKMFELDIHHRAISPCSLTKTENNETGILKYEVDVATAHNKGLFSMSDTVHRVECIYKTRRMGKHPVDVTKEMNPFKISVKNDNNQPFQQVQRGDIYYFNVEGSGKLPGFKGTRVSYLEAYGIDQQTGMVKRVKLIEDECPVRSTINDFGVSISNEERSQFGNFIGRAKVESFPIVEGEQLRLDYRAKICKNQCPQAHCNSRQPMQIPANAPFRNVVNAIEIV